MWTEKILYSIQKQILVPARLQKLIGEMSAPHITGRRSLWTERGDDNIFFTFGHCGAFVPSLAANGLIVMAPLVVYSIPKCGGVLGGNDQNRTENLVPTSDLVVRSSWSPKMFLILQRNLEGSLAGEFCGIFSGAQNEGPKVSGNFQSIFRK